MHHTADLSSAIAGILGSPISSFPQPYLGLLFSPLKLAISSYDPIIQSFERYLSGCYALLLCYLSGWCALLLSSSGRMVLCNAILNNLSTYYMCYYMLPPLVIEMNDHRRRVLFEPTRTLLQCLCLIIWDKVCRCAGYWRK